MRNESRAQLFAGLNPNQWVQVFEREDPENDPVFNYHGLNVHLEASELNQANVEVIIQDSRDGTNWTNRHVAPAPMVPGGELDISVYLQGRYHRLLVYSTGAGRVECAVLIPEEQVLPGLWPDVGTLACATYCEVSEES